MSRPLQGQAACSREPPPPFRTEASPSNLAFHLSPKRELDAQRPWPPALFLSPYFVISLRQSVLGHLVRFSVLLGACSLGVRTGLGSGWQMLEPRGALLLSSPSVEQSQIPTVCVLFFRIFPLVSWFPHLRLHKPHTRA